MLLRVPHVRSRSNSDSEAGTHKAGFPRHGVTIQGTNIQQSGVSMPSRVQRSLSEVPTYAD